MTTPGQASQDGDWDSTLRNLVPAVIAILGRRGVDFASAEDATQEALIRALATWPQDPPRDPRAWLVTTAWRRHLDATRSATSRREREAVVDAEPPADAASGVDDSLRLYFLCAHSSLSSTSAVALTLRAVGGLTTRQIADAYMVPEATMAQRISRAKRTIADVGISATGDLSTVLRVLYLVFNEGYSGDVDLVVEAIRMARQLSMLSDEPEAAGLLALMLLHHARRPSRIDTEGRLVPLAQQDRSKWDRTLIASGIEILHPALARDRLGQYQAQAAIAALHADAPAAAATDWVQIVEWYDDLLRFADTPIVRLNRAVAIGEADGPQAGLVAMSILDPALPRYDAALAYLHERAGDIDIAADLYARAALAASSTLERDHLQREAARLHSPPDPPG